MDQHYRHGDLLIVRTSGVPDGAEVEQWRQPAGVVLAYGKVTGHAHRIRSQGASVWNVGEQRYVRLDDDATLTHEEHGPIALDAGTYRVIRQREYTPEEIRLVAD